MAKTVRVTQWPGGPVIDFAPMPDRMEAVINDDGGSTT
jgi:hypothetical protein